MTLQEQLWAIAREYTRQTCELLGYHIDDAHWIGTDDHSGVLETCLIGERLSFTFDDMQTIVDDLDKWVKCYGSRELVRLRIEKWFNSESNVNLKAWMRGWKETFNNAEYEYNKTTTG